MKKIIIHAQYFENYAFADGGQSWKPKGGHTFEIVAADYEQSEFLMIAMMYDRDHVNRFAELFLAEKSNDACRFELVEIEPVFTLPTAAPFDQFQSFIQSFHQVPE